MAIGCARVRLALVLAVAGGIFLGAVGCFHGSGRQRAQRSSSVVAFLYPKRANPLPPTDIPVLRLPLRVGIAFVPSGGAGEISPLQKNALLERVAAQFQGIEYIESIEVVPATYLHAAGGFENLDQVRRLLNFDIVALVAYDQVQFTDANFLSLAYWTIVGAYIFQGNKNDTQTLLEAAVYDIPSRHLLFRAPGGSQVTAGAAGVYVQARLRQDSAKGFDLATDDLIKNLKTQLEDFRTRVKQAPGAVARIEHKPGYRGGGSFDAGFVLILALLVGVREWRRRR